MPYNIPIPRARGTLLPTVMAESITQQAAEAAPSGQISDIILHALIVRIAYADGHTEEFLTRLSPGGVLDIDIPQGRLDALISEVTLGPKLREFVRWLSPTTDLDERIDDAEAAITALEEADDGLDDRLGAVESAVDDLESADTAIDGRLDAAETAIVASVPATVTVTVSTTLNNPSRFLTVLINAASGHVVVTLPAPSAGRVINLKRIDSTLNSVDIVPPSGAIDGESVVNLANRYASRQLVSDDTNFYVTAVVGVSVAELDFSDENNSMYTGII